MRRDFLLRSSEWVLLAAGFLLVGLTGFTAFRSYVFGHWAGAVTTASGQRVAPLQDFRSSYLLRPIFNPSNVSFHIAGRLRVPRLGMSILVVDGDEQEALALAAAHLSGTAALGSKGNTVIAAHRDTAFWPLRNIKLGDSIQIKTSRTYVYNVTSIRIVRPDDTTVLADRGGSNVTLITCYPFRYIGSAPKRYVVQGDLLTGSNTQVPASGKSD